MNMVIILESILCGFWAIGMVLFSCEIGQRYSNAYEEIDNVVNQFDWYLFPLKIQRILPTIMMDTQQLYEIMCFGSTNCSRETFKRVSALKNTQVTLD